jgi:hypothetical protein
MGPVVSSGRRTITPVQRSEPVPVLGFRAESYVYTCVARDGGAAVVIENSAGAQGCHGWIVQQRDAMGSDLIIFPSAPHIGDSAPPGPSSSRA